MKIDITGLHYELNDKITEYVEKKINALDKYFVKTVSSVRAAVVLSEDPSGREGSRFVCEAIIHVPNAKPIQAKDGTINMFAAVDIVEAKLKAQILKLKTKQNPRWHQGRKWLNKIISRSQTR